MGAIIVRTVSLPLPGSHAPRGHPLTSSLTTPPEPACTFYPPSLFLAVHGTDRSRGDRRLEPHGLQAVRAPRRKVRAARLPSAADLQGDDILGRDRPGGYCEGVPCTSFVLSLVYVNRDVATDSLLGCLADGYRADLCVFPVLSHVR